MATYLRKHQSKLTIDIQEQEEKFLLWALGHREQGRKTSEFFITQTFVNGKQPNKKKSIRSYMTTFLLNLANQIGVEVYAVGGSWNWYEDKSRKSHFHLMVSIPLSITPSVVMKFGTMGKNGRKLSRWGRSTIDVYEPSLGGFPYILSKHDWETDFTPFHPRGK